MSSEPPGRPVELAAVAKAQGLRGEVALRLFNPDSPLLEVGRRFWLAGPGPGGRWVELQELRVSPRGAVVKLEGISSREAAERLVGARLMVDRAELPVLGEQEAYLADLVGMTVLDVDGKRRGVVVDVEVSGKQDFLVVEEAGRRELWPAEPAVIASIDAGGRVVKLAVSGDETEQA